MNAKPVCIVKENPMQEIIELSGQLPLEVLRDINRRIGDWLAMGGKDDDPYIEQQLRFAKRFIVSEDGEASENVG